MSAEVFKPPVELVSIVVHLPKAAAQSFPASQVVEWNPQLPALSVRLEDESIHTFFGCAFEAVFRESRIARIA